MSLALALPLALGGDSANPSGSAVAAIGLVSIVGGYLLLAALWYFVFRQRPEEREAKRRAAEAQASATEDPALAATPPPVHPRERRRITRSPTSPFRRR